MRRRDFLKTSALPAITPASAETSGQPEALEHPDLRAWRANWIWIPAHPGSPYKTLNEQQSRNAYFYARKVFSLADVPDQVEARVSADSRYVLYVNGQRIGFGPARCDPRRQCYDIYTVEIRRALRPGTNVIAALVHHIGESTFSYILGRAGFLFEAEIGALQIQTDPTWRLFPGIAWQYVPNRLSLQTDFPEIYDARLEPGGWHSVGFDDSRWQPPVLIGPPPVAPWGHMVPRDIPFFAETDVAPHTVLAAGEALALEHEFGFDTYDLFGRPEVVSRKTAEIRCEVHAPNTTDAHFVIGYTNPYEVSVNGATVARCEWRQGADSGHMVKHRLPAVRLNAGRNDLVILLHLGGRIKDLYCGHIGNAGALEYRNWSVPARSNRQTEIAVIQQTELQFPRPNSEAQLTRIEPGGRDQFVLLDFGREVFGYPTLRIRSAGEGLIDLGYSELLVDGRPVPNKTGLSNADRYILRPGAQTWQTFEKRAFRYMQLDFRHLTAPVELESVGLRFSTYPVEHRGRFHCSDSLLNRIWETGRYTVQLNMDDAFTDCPWRERGMWMGDARVEGLIAFYAFGDSKLLKRCLRLIGESQTGDGLTYGVYPTPIDFRLPSFTLLWIASIWDYYFHTGDVALLRELYPKVLKALSFFERWTDEFGLISDLQKHYWVFIDWTPLDARGEATPVNCFYAGTLDTAARMAAALGRLDDTKRLRSLAARTRTAVRQRLWSAERAVFVDCRTPDGQSATISQPANSLAVLYGVARADERRKIFDYILNPANGAVPVGSPYFSFYLLSALYLSDKHGEALRYIRNQWSKMLDAGATTWWEAWNGKESLCHGWSAGPTYDLMSEFAGIKPAAPGFRKVLIQPNPQDLEHISALVPTERGEVSAAWQTEKDGFSLAIVLPKGTTARVSLPRIYPGTLTVHSDGQTVTGLHQTPSRVEFDWNVSGKRTFTLRKG